MEQADPTSIILKREDLNSNDPNLLTQLNLDAGALYAQYPPNYRSRSKLRSFEKVKAEADYNPTQVLRLTRWSAMKLPETYKVDSKVAFHYDDKVFQYVQRPEPGIYKEIDWHMNFADSHLFCAYAGSLLAQDELQVLECPILASIREFLMKDPAGKEFPPYTVQSREPTPILIGNADRVISLDTYPDASKDRPRGLYGNNFERASENAVDLATNILKPSHKANIFALEAPAGGYGQYTEKTIAYILQTCYTGFIAAKRESQKVSALIREEKKVEGNLDEKEIHTHIYSGFWGCGAYGGDRTLMVILQLIAAHLAEVDSLTIHAVHKEGLAAVEFALKRFEEILKDVEGEINVNELVTKLQKSGFRWGFSNGT